MEYMEQMMQQEMEASRHFYNEACIDLKIDVERYISICGYSWTVDMICEQYLKMKKNEYIPHTANEIITQFKKRFELIMGAL